MITLSDVQSSPGIQRVLGVCPTSADAAGYINEAGRRLMRRGDWFETFVPIFVGVYNGCLVTPRYVQQVRRMNFCNREVPVRNGWWEMLAYNQTYAGWRGWYESWCGQSCGLRGQNVSPVMQDIQGDGRLVRAYPRCAQDTGKIMTIFGLDNNGQALVTVDPTTGAITQGALLTLALPFGSTSSFVRSISYIVRDPTTLPVDCYAYNATTNLLEDLAHYDPDETTPSYTRYKLDVPWPYGCVSSQYANCSAGMRGVLMMVKLRWIDAQNPMDLVLVPCVDALKLMIQAIRREDAGDRDGARAFEKDAIEVLNRELETNSPDEIFTVSNDSLGHGVRMNHCF